MRLNLSSGGFVAPVAVTGTAVAVVFHWWFLELRLAGSTSSGESDRMIGVILLPSFSPSLLVTAPLRCCGGPGGFCPGGPLRGFSALLWRRGGLFGVLYISAVKILHEGVTVRLSTVH